MAERSFIIALVGLTVVSVIVTGGMVALSLHQLEIPPALSAVAGTCLGSISGLLSQPRPPEK